MKILLITTVHGDEEHAHQVGVHVKRLLSGNLGADNVPANIDVLVANPDARKAGKRFLETDLNRSFAAELPLSLEEKLAQKLKAKFAIRNYDLVVDMHNTTAKGTTCAIVVTKPSPVQLSAATAFGMQRIVQMPPSGSLLAALANPGKGISIEVAVDDEENYPAARLAEIIVDLARMCKLKPLSKDNDVSLYKFVSTVQKSTLKRAGLSGVKKKRLANFRALTPAQKAKLGIYGDRTSKGGAGEGKAVAAGYYPIFLGGKHMGESVMNLVEKVS